MTVTSEPILPPLATPLLRGKTAIITGGAGGIGRVTAKLFADQGARVAIIDTAPSTPAVAKEIGGEHLGLTADVTDKSACDKAVAATIAAFGRTDILVPMAGPVNPGKTVEISREDYDLIVDAHLRGTFNICQTA